MPLPTSDSVFKRLSNLVRARDIMTPIAMTCEWHIRVIDALKLLDKKGRLGDAILVRQDNGFDAYFSPASIDLNAFDDDGYSKGGPLADAEAEQESLEACEIGAVAWEDRPVERSGKRPEVGSTPLLSGDVSLFELLDLLNAYDVATNFIVIDGRDFAGVVRYEDVMKPPARVCLFALTLELEFAALRLCGDFAEQCFAALSPARREKAKSHFLSKYGDDANFNQLFADRKRDFGKSFIPQGLLDCTMFVDKSTMIRKCKLTGENHTRIKSVFKGAEDLRNACAHTALVDHAAPLKLKKLVALIHDCHDLIDTFTRMRSKRKST